MAEYKALVISERAEWQARLRAALGAVASEIQTAGRPAEVALALQNAPDRPAFDLVVIDLWLDKPLEANDSDDDGTHDGLEALLAAGQHQQGARLIVICEAGGYETLRATPGVPDAAFFIPRERFDSAVFTVAAQKLVSAPAKMIPDLPDTPPELIRPLGSKTAGGGRSPISVPMPAVGARPGKARVLIVEDQLFWQETLARALEDSGYFWRLATTGDGAIGRLLVESFHVVLFGLSDPDARKGWALLDYVVEKCPKTRLLVVGSNLTSAEVARLFMGYPTKGFIDISRFNKDDLLTLIEQQMIQARLSFQTLGDFRVSNNGRLVNNYGHPLAEMAVKVLLTRRGESVSADELIEYLWPGADRRARYPMLNEIINAARLALEPELARAIDSRIIMREGTSYRLVGSEQVSIDAEHMRRLIEEARAHEARGEAEPAMKAYQAIDEMYKGDFLPGDRASAWTMKARAALQALYTEALNRLADLYAGRGKLDMAISAANKALQTDAYGEGTYRRLMRYYACKGDKNAALGTYKALVKLFSEFIGEAVSPASARLHEDIAAGREVECVEVTTAQWRAATTDGNAKG
jgi:DNA-binding SARP family transcriptional activator/CheY-like chemotaxis protein